MVGIGLAKVTPLFAFPLHSMGGAKAFPLGLDYGQLAAFVAFVVVGGHIANSDLRVLFWH